MGVGKANGAENIQSQNGDDQQEQIPGGRSGGIRKLNHHRLEAGGFGLAAESRPKVDQPRSYRSSFVLLNPDF